MRISYWVKKNKKNEFFTVEGLNPGVGIKEPDFLEEDSACLYKCKHDYAICIWPFKDGYARFIGKNGNWGFINEETLDSYELENDVLYAEDFSSGMARIQFVDYSFNYLTTELKWLSNTNYSDATNFEDGYAIVSDTICKHYQIDKKGSVSDKDKRRYEIAMEFDKIKNFEEKEKRIKHKELHKRTCGSIDPESIIMDTLSGKGDSDDWGF